MNRYMTTSILPKDFCHIGKVVSGFLPFSDTSRMTGFKEQLFALKENKNIIPVLLTVTKCRLKSHYLPN